MRPPPRRQRPSGGPALTTADRLVSAAFGAVFGAIVVVLYALLFGRGGASFGAGFPLLAWIGWFAGGFGLVGLVFGPVVGDLLGSLIAGLFEYDRGQGEAEAPRWLVLGLAAALAIGLLWWWLS